MSSDEIDLADIDPLLGDDPSDEPLSVAELDEAGSANPSSNSSPATAHTPSSRHTGYPQQQQQQRPTSRQSASSPRSSSSSSSSSARRSARVKSSSTSFPSRSVSAALPLLLQSSTATSLLKLSSDSSAAGLSYSLAALHLSSRRTATHSQSRSATSGKATATAGSTSSQQQETVEDRRAEVHKPYFVQEGEASDGGVPSGSAAELLKGIGRQWDKEADEERYDFHYRLRRHAIALLAAQKANYAHAAADVPTAATDTSPASPTASLSSLLLSVLSSSSSSASFLSTFEQLMSSQSPFSLRLSPTEQRYYDTIVELLSSSAASPDGRVVESLLRYWLGLGSMAHSLQAVNYLLSLHSAASPASYSSSGLALSPSLTSFLHEWSSRLAAMRSTLVRLGRSKHLTAIPSSTRRVSLFTSVPSSLSHNKSKRPHCGRKWDCEDDNGWERFDDRTSALLEAAYQQGRPYIDYTVEGKPHTYRADFQRMVQRNLQTGREKPLRTLLALLIREKSGRITQTVEINMPHSTSIRELRKELAQYLKHDEKQLRMMYANRVLRRIDYAHITIRDGIVPLGAEPLMVTKINKGDLEELCTFVLTGTEEVRQERWECITCDFVDGRSFCSICAQVCHKGHVVRLLPSSAASFCHCGAGAGGHEAPCQALEESPGDREPTHPPSMCVSACGQFLYTLSSEMGLVKLGTGGGAGDSCTGNLYTQNTLMCVHAGGCLVEVGGRLLLRSPMVREDVLLAIDPHTLLFTSERVVLGGREVEAQEDEQAALSSWLTEASSADDPAFLFSTSWTLEYNHNKLDVDDVEDAASKDGSNSAAAAASDEATWTALSPYFLLRIKQALLSNPSYGQLISSSASPHSALSPEVPSLSIEEEGLFLRLPCKLGMKRCRVRIKHREHVMPVYSHDGSLLALNLVGLGEAPSQPRQRRARNAAMERSQLREEKEERKENDEKKEEVVSVMPVQEKATRKSRVRSIVVNSRVSGTDNRKDREREEKERERERDSERRERQSASIPRLIALTPYRKSRRRQQSMLLDVYALPTFPSSNSDKLSSAVSLPVCSLCGHLPTPHSSSSTSRTVDPLSLSGSPHSSPVCPLCAHYSQPLGDSDPDLLIVLDDDAQRQLAKMKEEDKRKTEDERKRRVDAVTQQLAQLTVRGSRAAADSAADGGSESSAVSSSPPIPINRQYAERLESLGFSPLRVQKALVHTRNSSLELALQWLCANAEQPDVDAPWPKSKLEASLPPPQSSSSVQSQQAHSAFVNVSFLYCASEACIPLDCVVDKYRAIKPTSVPSGKDAKLAPVSAAPAATCDGCGVSSAVSSARSIRPLLMCSHRDCKDIYLCDHCALMGNWQHSPHQHTHHLERSAIHPSQQQTERDEVRLTLGEFTVYLDSAHQQLAVIKQRDSTRKECVDLFDIGPGLQGREDDAACCVARDVFVNTKGDCFVYDGVNSCVWAMSLSSGRLERWLAAPLVSPSPTPTWDSITPVEAASSILHHLSCVATSPAVIALSLQRTFAALQTIFGSASLRNETIAVDTLGLLHSCINRWQQHGVVSSELQPVGAEHAASEATAGVDVNALIASIRVFLEQNVLQLSRLASLAPTSPASQTTKQALSADSTSPSPVPQLVDDTACAILVDGFELFYQTWRQRLSRIHSLLFTAAASPVSSHILQLLSAHYQAMHLGLLTSSPASSSVVDLSLLSGHTQHTMSLLLKDVADTDVENVSTSVSQLHRSRPDVSYGGQRSSQHVGTYVVLAYQSELLRLLAEVEGHLAALQAATSDKHDVVGRGGSSSPDEVDADMLSVSEYEHRDERARLQRRSKQLNSAYVRLCHGGFVKSQLLLARYEEEINRAAATSNSDSGESAKAERAESVLALFSQSSIGLLLPWLILSLPDLQVGKVQSAELSSLLSSIIALLCKLSSLSSAAMSVTRTMTDKPQQLRLTNIRAKIAQLRQSQQLLASELPAPSAPSSSFPSASSPSAHSAASSSASKRKRKSSGSSMRLHPFAAEVFGLIFHEFATPSSFSVSGVPAMNKQNFCLYLKRKSSVTTEQAMSRTAAVFSKYGVPPSAAPMDGVSSHSSSSVFRISEVGNEPSHLLLDGFLTYQFDLAVESGPRVLKELRFLESRHSFNNTHHAAPHAAAGHEGGARRSAARAVRSHAPNSCGRSQHDAVSGAGTCGSLAGGPSQCEAGSGRSCQH